MTKFVGCFILLTSLYGVIAVAQEPQPAPQMQSLAKAFEGKWAITEKYEPDEWTPNGGTGYGEEIWRRGPGGFTFMEEVHDHGPAGESFGLALSWWDKDKGFQGLWCENHDPRGCAIGRDVNGSFKWDGKQQVVDNEFQRNGKTFKWHEVFTDITPTSFVQTADIGEKGSPLKRWLTIHATRVATRAGEPSQSSANNGEQTVSPSPEIQKVFATQLGRWSQREERADGSMSQGEAVWRAGPGAMSLLEDEHIRRASGDFVGLSVTWWDAAAKGYRALWCDNKIKSGCLVMTKPAHWEGDQFVLDDEFERDGKKFVYKEGESKITSSTYTLTSYIGEDGGQLKPTSTIHATKIAEEGSVGDADLRAAMAKRHQAMIEGDEAMVDRMTAKEYVQTDIFGHVQDKSTWMVEYFRPLAALTKAGKFRWERYDERDVRVVVLGDTAVVTGELVMKGTGAKLTQGKWEEAPGASIEGNFRFTRVWIKRDGSWLLAALHNSAPMGVR